MHSGESLDRIVRYYRAKYYQKPAKPVRLRQLSDVKRFPNDILMSYLIADLGLDRAKLAAFLKDIGGLEGWLEDCVPKHIPHTEELPTLFSGVTYDVPLCFVSRSIEVDTGKFCVGDEYKLLIADKAKRVHRYPSGTEAEYFLLTDEKPANVSIFEAGYGVLSKNAPDETPDEICVRENFVTMMMAFMDAVRDDPEFSQYSEQMEDFQEQVAGIVIAHEKSELEMIKSGEAPEKDLQRELTAEHRARIFLVEQGVDIRAYELFHLLRASHDEEMKNVSGEVVAQTLKPLA